MKIDLSSLNLRPDTSTLGVCCNQGLLLRKILQDETYHSLKHNLLHYPPIKINDKDDTSHG